MTEKTTFWHEWTEPEKEVWRTLAAAEERLSRRDLASRMHANVDYVGRIVRVMMERLGIDLLAGLNSSGRYTELWRIARDSGGIPPPPQADVDWIMRLNADPTILQQADRERADPWVIDECAIGQPIFQFRGIDKEHVKAAQMGRFPLIPELERIKASERKPGVEYRTKVCFLGHSPIETDIIDADGLTLRFGEMDWLDVRAFSLGLAELRQQGSYQGPLLDVQAAKVPCIGCMHCILQMADGKVVIARRSGHRDYSPLAWSLSFEEQLSNLPRHSTSSGQPDIHPFDAVIWGAYEEFHVRVIPSSVRLLAIGTTLPAYSSALIASARCAEPSSQLRSCWRQANDRDEHDRVEALDPRTESLGRHFFQLNPAPEFDPHPVWHGTSRMRLVAFLAHRWGLGKALQDLATFRDAQSNPG